MGTNLSELFHKWQDLNTKIEGYIKKFEFSSMRELRNKQREIEDRIYSTLLENATENLKKILPEDCGDLEPGYDITNNVFYFLMEDPTSENTDELTIIAITIDSNKNLNIIQNFKQND
jgi:hypothetical protein